MITSKLSQLIYGGDFQPEAWPEALWVEDVALMRRAGVNCVTIGTLSWAKLQPAPDQFNLDWLERVLNLLHEFEIVAGLSTATAVPPAWFSQLSPETFHASENGPLQFCPHSEAYREYAARLARQLAARFGAHPALAFWQVNLASEGSIPCRGDRCTVNFRTWLQARYQTIEVLNEHWNTAHHGCTYQKWEEIHLPPASWPRPVPAQELDYRRFTSDAWLGCFLNEKKVLRELTLDIPVTATFSGSRGLSAAIDGFALARHVDFVSFSANPDPLDGDSADLAFVCDVQRGLSGGKPWLFRHAPVRDPARAHHAVPRPNQTRLWTTQALAHGADGVMFSRWRASAGGPEKFESAMLPHGFTETRAFADASQIGAEMSKLVPILGATTRAEVALMLDWENLWAVDLDSQPARLNYTEMVRSYYRALFEPDVPIDIVPPEAALANYKLVIAPALHMVRPGVAENLQDFVDNGGTFLTTFFSGLVDASNRVLPGGFPAAFRQLLGLRVEEFDVFGNQIRHIKTSLRGARCLLWADIIFLEGAEAVASFTEDFYAHRPAITRNAVGRGLAYYVGTQPEPAFLRSFLAEICVDCGVRPPMRVPAGVEATTRSNENGEFLFLLNHNTTLQFTDIGLRPRRDLLTGEIVQGQCQITPRGARVLQLV
jgi:beta-galactosidase